MLLVETGREKTPALKANVKENESFSCMGQRATMCLLQGHVSILPYHSSL